MTQVTLLAGLGMPSFVNGLEKLTASVPSQLGSDSASSSCLLSRLEKEAA